MEQSDKYSKTRKFDQRLSLVKFPRLFLEYLFPFQAPTGCELDSQMTESGDRKKIYFVPPPLPSPQCWP